MVQGGGSASPSRYLIMSRVKFGCHNCSQGEHTGIQWIEARDTTKYHIMHKVVLHKKGIIEAKMLRLRNTLQEIVELHKQKLFLIFSDKSYFFLIITDSLAVIILNKRLCRPYPITLTLTRQYSQLILSSRNLGTRTQFMCQSQPVKPNHSKPAISQSV